MVLIIAEAGVNHNGSLTLAKELIDAAKDCNADVIKFQLFKADDLVTKSARKANYQRRQSERDLSQFAMLKKLELSFEEHQELKEYSVKRNIEFLSSGFDLGSINMLKKLNLKRYKIPSGEINNLPYLRLVGSQKKPVILSTGMSNINEIGEAINILILSGTKKEDITVLHCTTEYPAPINEVNLRAMNTIKNTFKIKVGYSDHTLGIDVSLAAVALGAVVIEKHLTLDRDLSGPDHKASLEPNQFKSLVEGIRKISIALGSEEKKITPSELKNLSKVRKSITAKTDIKKGELFSKDNLCLKRPGTGLSPMEWDQIIGKRSKKTFKADDLISYN